MSLGIGESSILLISELFERELGLGLQHGLNSLLSFLDILGGESASWGSDLSDLVGSGVVRFVSLVSDSVCHGFIIFIFQL